MGSHIILGKILFSLLVTAVLSDDPLLPTYAVPSSYSLDLILDPRATNYDGLVEIIFTQTDLDVNTIQLYASSETIDIQDVLLNYEHTCVVKTVDNDTDIVTLECPAGSLVEENRLTINFKGIYDTEDTRGLYKRTYDENGEEIALLATQFEPTDARRAFPSFDEPSFKATFDVFITHPDDYNALSNMPVTKTFSVSPDNIQTQFYTTPSVSTNVVSFIVFKFVSNDDAKIRDYDLVNREVSDNQINRLTKAIDDNTDNEEIKVIVQRASDIVTVNKDKILHEDNNDSTGPKHLHI